MISKLKTILFIAFIYSTPTYSQWAPIGSTWYTGIVESYFSAAQGFKVTQSVSDTSILGINCKMLISEMHHSFTSNVDVDTNFMYEDSGIVYDFVEGQFSVLYNFNANSGDTWNISVQYPSPFVSGNPPDTIVTIVVDSTSSIIIGGQSKKTLYVHSVDNDWYFRNPLIEDIGSFGGIYPFIYDWMDIDIPYLRCYIDSNIYFVANPLFPCDTLISRIDKNSETSRKVILYPNPATENITILTSARANESQLTIYNVTGQFQFRKLVPAGTKNINVEVSHFGPGSYFFEIRNQAEVESGFFLIY